MQIMALDIPQPTSFAPWLNGRNLQCCLAILVAVCMTMTSCESAPDIPVSERSAYSVDVDWSGYEKDVPSGMTILFHHCASGEMTRVTGSNTSSASALLAPGRHWATVFNLSPDKFANIGFRGLETAATAEAYAREYTGPIWHNIPRDEYSYVARQPEWLAADTILTSLTSQTGPGAGHEVIGTLHPHNIIHTLHISVTLSNPDAILSGRGAVSGMAAGRRLSASAPDPGAPTVVHLIEPESWTVTKEGVAKAEVRCFGLPAGRSATPEENIFEFQALLSDGKTVKSYIIPAGNLMKRLPGGETNNLDLWLDVRVDLPPNTSGSSGGMDVWLNIWDESIDHDIPL